jgi:hypothetical protein
MPDVNVAPKELNQIIDGQSPKINLGGWWLVAGGWWLVNKPIRWWASSTNCLDPRPKNAQPFVH